jgi:biotin operon repressor
VHLPNLLEERIKELCAQLLATKDPASAQEIALELRATIHEHIETLRQSLLEIPSVSSDAPLLAEDS